MSKSFHVTRKKLTKYTKKELDEMVDDPDSELAEYAQKRSVKKKVKQERKSSKTVTEQSN
jgi:hypothetical protein